MTGHDFAESCNREWAILTPRYGEQSDKRKNESVSLTVGSFIKSNKILIGMSIHDLISNTFYFCS